jgi:hypothetical protein
MSARPTSTGTLADNTVSTPRRYAESCQDPAGTFLISKEPSRLVPMTGPAWNPMRAAVHPEHLAANREQRRAPPANFNIAGRRVRVHLEERRRVFLQSVREPRGNVTYVTAGPFAPPGRRDRQDSESLVVQARPTEMTTIIARHAFGRRDTPARGSRPPEHKEHSRTLDRIALLVDDPSLDYGLAKQLAIRAGRLAGCHKRDLRPLQSEVRLLAPDLIAALSYAPKLIPALRVGVRHPTDAILACRAFRALNNRHPPCAMLAADSTSTTRPRMTPVPF